MLYCYYYYDYFYFGEILEGIAFQEFTKYLETNNKWADQQFGFRAGYSCEQDVLDLVESVRRALDGGYITLAVFNDF